MNPGRTEANGSHFLVTILFEAATGYWQALNLDAKCRGREHAELRRRSQ